MAPSLPGALQTDLKTYGFMIRFAGFLLSFVGMPRYLRH
jgi:hypothetical protein